MKLMKYFPKPASRKAKGIPGKHEDCQIEKKGKNLPVGEGINESGIINLMRFFHNFDLKILFGEINEVFSTRSLLTEM